MSAHLSSLILAPRTEKEIERSITHFDVEYEMWLSSRKKFVMYDGRVQAVKAIQGATALTNKWMEPIYESPSAGTAKNTFTTEFQLNDTAGMGPVPVIPAYYFLPGTGARGKQLRVIARGIQLGTGSTPPTWLFNFRLNAVVTPAVPPTGSIISGMPAAVTGTTTASTMWEAEFDVQMLLEGAAGANSTLRGLGQIISTRGFVSPFGSDLFAGGASPGTVATYDHSLLSTLTVGCICGTSLAANQMQLLQLLIFGEAS